MKDKKPITIIVSTGPPGTGMTYLDFKITEIKKK